MNRILLGLWIALVMGVLWVLAVRGRWLRVDVVEGYDLPLVQRTTCRVTVTGRSGARTWIEGEEIWRGFLVRLAFGRALFVGRRDS